LRTPERSEVVKKARPQRTLSASGVLSLLKPFGFFCPVIAVLFKKQVYCIPASPFCQCPPPYEPVPFFVSGCDKIFTGKRIHSELEAEFYGV